MLSVAQPSTRFSSYASVDELHVTLRGLPFCVKGKVFAREDSGEDFPEACHLDARPIVSSSSVCLPALSSFGVPVHRPRLAAYVQNAVKPLRGRAI